MIFNHVRWGNDLLACRLENRLSLTDVQPLIVVDKTTLAHYERGEDNLKMQHFLSLCNLYDLDPREYFELVR